MQLQYEITQRWSPTQVFDDASDAAANITSNEDYINEMDVSEYVDENLDSEYGSIEICGHTFYASSILYNMNEDVYNDYCEESRRDYAEGNMDYVAETIENLDPGETVTFEGGITVTCIEVLDEDDEAEAEGFDHDGFESVFE